jgi:predicted ATPase
MWDEAEEWLKRIDPGFTLLKSPLRGNQASIETTRKYPTLETDVNLAFQGGGIQRALQIICAVVFSPRESVIIIEEPEMNLHKDSQEILVDLFNKAVNEWNKQVIITTHSWNMILPIWSDIGLERSRRSGDNHIKTDASKFKLVAFWPGDQIQIKDYNIDQKKFTDMQQDFKLLWG